MYITASRRDGTCGRALKRAPHDVPGAAARGPKMVQAAKGRRNHGLKPSVSTPPMLASSARRARSRMRVSQR
jgi:hypothetical protein